ncbi:unnamed protein product [Phytophthora fragariaefolia]|uniref:Unnamed protein product n=1 Tax=Phytophthora fragariaefolia TaxID=1490495 RepID=A0A9W6XTA5_9STRA|nr:unnamed protein product [Phytophthora fragariaefolia]
MWLPGDTIPRLGEYITVGLHRYAEWQNLAFQATTDLPNGGPDEKSTGSMVERSQYATPKRILSRPTENHRPVTSVTVAGPSPVETEGKLEAEERIRDRPSDVSSPVEVAVQDQTDTTPAETPIEPAPSEMEPAESPQGESVCYNEGGELFAEDVESHWWCCRRSPPPPRR